jgi:Lrp/AsnC family transcriptional regulator for asnA, asnC and gidA
LHISEVGSTITAVKVKHDSRGRVDDLDRRIIACLQEDGRQRTVRIARHLEVSEGTVRRRIAQLLAAKVIRISAVANPLMLDYPVVAIFGFQVTPSNIAHVGEALNQIPDFRFIGHTTGVYDFVAEAWFASLEDLRRFLTDSLTSVEGLVKVDTAHVLQMIRYTYDWGQDGRTGLGLRPSNT